METIRCKNNFGKIVNIEKEKFVFRPSAYGLILHKGKIVTLKNKSNKKIWFPGGGIEIGERMEQGLLREIKEETGLKVKIKKLIFSKENFFYYQPLDEAYHAFLFFYLCEPIKTRMISDEEVQDYESEKPRWTEIKKIKKEDISDLNDEIFSVLNNLKKLAGSQLSVRTLGTLMH
ncbi:MAG: NUDIX domain-containing protein [bacterium]